MIDQFNFSSDIDVINSNQNIILNLIFVSVEKTIGVFMNDELMFKT